MVSVIVPAYNASATLERTLRALQAQTVPRGSYEVIVVDDGSTDDTAAIAARWADRVVRQERAGPAAARNRGASVAKGDILVFTDSDCEPDPQWLERLTAPLADPTVGACKGAYKTRQRGIVPRFAQVEFEERYNRLRKYPFIDFVDTYSAAIRASVFREVGGFDVRFPKANNEDVDLSYKLAARGVRMVFVPDALVSHTHASTLGKYLRTKFLRAYWRALVYRRHPAKLVADTYTPQLLKLQVVTVPVAVVSTLAALTGLVPWAVSGGMWLLSTLASLPLLVTALHKDPAVAPVVVPLAMARAMALGAGGFLGTLAHRREDLLVPSMLLLADTVAVVLSLLGAFFLRTQVFARALSPFAHELEIYLKPLPLVVALWLLSFASLNLYAVRVHTTPFVEFVRVSRGSLFSLLVIMSLSFLAKFDYSRLLVLFFFLLVVPLAVAGRSAVRVVHRRLVAQGYRSSRCLVVGGGDAARGLVQKMLRFPSLGCTPVGVVSQSPPPWAGPEIPWVGSPDHLSALATTLGVDEVYLADPTLSPVETMALAVACDSVGASCKVLAPDNPLKGANGQVTSLTSVSMLDLSRPRLSPLHDLLKTAVDRFVALVVLSLALPFLLAYSLSLRARRLPVFVREGRVGRGGRSFVSYRFTFPPSPCLLDRWVRACALDRLPRLWSVLRGDMSLVGPRGEPPERPVEAPWERLLLDVRPGITGLWLVGREGEMGAGTDVEHDFYYLRNRSFLLDLAILLRSVAVIWRRRRT